MDSPFAYPGVAALLRDNAALDTELIALADAVTPDLLHASQGSVRWTLAEQLGHVGEFPGFLAADLLSWMAGGSQVGRTDDDPARMAAIAAAPSRTLGELKSALPPAFAGLAAVLERLTPGHLAAQIDHRGHGREPLASHVLRDIIGHKRQHIDQLHTSFDYLAGGRMRLDGFVPVPHHFAERYRRDGLWQGRTLGELFDQWAARSCERAAVTGIDVDGVAQHLSYAALRQRVNNLAAHLQQRGIALGSRVVVQLPNVPGFVTLLLALFKIGAVPVLALPQHGEHEIGYLLDHSGATAYAVARTFRGDDCVARARVLRASHLSLQQILVSGDPGTDDVIALDRLETAPPPSAVIRGPVACDVAMFLLSGGTTGAPKLIPRTHDDYALNLRESARVCGFDRSTVYLVALPAAHNFPLGCPVSWERSAPVAASCLHRPRTPRRRLSSSSASASPRPRSSRRWRFAGWSHHDSRIAICPR